MSQHHLPRILIINHDVVGQRMAGPGIRAWHMARVLAAHGAVTLIAPRPIDLQSPDFACGDYHWGDAASLAGWLERADVVVANGFVLEAHPELANVPQPLALDLYDPVLLENIELMREQPPEARAARAATDQQLLARQLAAGDFFLCATERQRDLYLGALMLAGRLTPAQIDADPTARALIDVAPFGLDPAPPARQGPALRGVLPGIGADDLVLLWTGGLWDWLDPLTLIDAMPQVVERHQAARLVFLAGRHPGTAAEMRMPERARARAAERGLLGTHIFFYDEWVPYERRADFLLDATVAVSLHRNHLETAYAAVRSRFLDHLWASLPSLVSDGDAAADLVRANGLGAVVPPGDVAATAAALIGLLSDLAELAACGSRARALAHEFAWERALGVLIRFCKWTNTEGVSARNKAIETKVDSNKGFAEAQNTGAVRMEQTRKHLLGQLEMHWQLTVPLANGLRGLMQRIALRVLAPVLAEQREFNAATIRIIYEFDAQVSSQLNAVMAHVTTLQTIQDQRHQSLLNNATRLDEAIVGADRIQVELSKQLADLKYLVSEAASRATS